MIEDEAIAEVRKVRHQISEEYGHDPKALLDHLRELEKNYTGRLFKKRGDDRPLKKAS